MITPEKISLMPLEKATHSLELAVIAYQNKPGDEFIRDACIQRFEYTYELCGKFLKRFLEASEMNPALIKEMSFPTLIRTANEKNLLLNSWPVWKEYREARNITSHTYDKLKAEKVAAISIKFLEDAKFLLNSLQIKIKNL